MEEEVSREEMEKEVYTNDSKGALFRVRHILRTPEAYSVAEQARKIMKILERYNAKDIKDIFKEKNDEEWLDHFCREVK